MYRRTETYPKIDLYKEKYQMGFVLKTPKKLIPPSEHAKYMTAKLVTFTVNSIGGEVDETIKY